MDFFRFLWYIHTVAVRAVFSPFRTGTIRKTALIPFRNIPDAIAR